MSISCLSWIKNMTSLSYNNRKDFVTLQCSKKTYWCAIYRTLFACYITSVLAYCALTSGYAEKVFIFLTYWSFTALALCQITSFLNTWTYTELWDTAGLPNPDQLPWQFRLQWLFYNVSSGVAFVITLMFWAFIFHDDDEVTFCNFNLHAVNSAFVLLDTLATSVPVYFRHCVYSIIYGIVYSLFAVFYWSIGGTNHKGEPFIYKPLDFGNHPVQAFIYLTFVCFILTPLSHFILCILYKLRVIFHKGT